MPKRFSSFLAQIVMTHVVMTHVVMTSGCLYDWEVGPAASSGQTSSSSGGGAGGAGADCAMLGQALETTRGDAKACTFGVPNQCTASIMDERKCTTWVHDGSSAATNAFTKAVADFVAAGCTPSATACGMTTPTCLYVAGKPICTP